MMQLRNRGNAWHLLSTSFANTHQFTSKRPFYIGFQRSKSHNPSPQKNHPKSPMNMVHPRDGRQALQHYATGGAAPGSLGRGQRAVLRGPGAMPCDEAALETTLGAGGPGELRELGQPSFSKVRCCSWKWIILVGVQNFEKDTDERSWSTVLFRKCTVIVYGYPRQKADEMTSFCPILIVRFPSHSTQMSGLAGGACWCWDDPGSL